MSKIKKDFLLAMTLTSLISFSAIAGSTSICVDPLKKICQETQAQRLKRDFYIETLKNEISLEAEKNAAVRIDILNKETSPIRFFKRFIGKIKIRNQEIMKSAKKRIQGFESVVTDNNNIEKN